MSSSLDHREARQHPVTAATEAFAALPVEQRAIALAAVLIEAGVITELQLRTAVFGVSGNPIASIERSGRASGA
jgi:hypothetical protein